MLNGDASVEQPPADLRNTPIHGRQRSSITHPGCTVFRRPHLSSFAWLPTSIEEFPGAGPYVVEPHGLNKWCHLRRWCLGAGEVAARALLTVPLLPSRPIVKPRSVTPGTRRPSRSAALRLSGFAVLKRCGWWKTALHGNGEREDDRYAMDAGSAGRQSRTSVPYW